MILAALLFKFVNLINFSISWIGNLLYCFSEIPKIGCVITKHSTWGDLVWFLEWVFGWSCPFCNGWGGLHHKIKSFNDSSLSCLVVIYVLIILTLNDHVLQNYSISGTFYRCKKFPNMTWVSNKVFYPMSAQMAICSMHQVAIYTFMS